MTNNTSKNKSYARQGGYSVPPLSSVTRQYSVLFHLPPHALVDESALMLALEEVGAVVASLLSRSYAVVTLSEEATPPLGQREAFLARAFDLSHDIKISCGEFRTVEGYSIGYKREGRREFFESRVTRLATMEPLLPLEKYEDYVIGLCRTLNNIGMHILSEISRVIGLDSAFLSDLVDWDLCPLPDAPFSASVLRICSYPPSQEEISFGAHTDTSFLTICPICDVPGLEVFDPQDRRWRDIEAEVHGSGAVIVLVGELLQILLKGRFRACVHRVRSPLEGHRFSSPWLIRGRRRATIDPLHGKYKHRISIEEVTAMVALDGVSMGEVHLLLDFKRRRCSKQNQTNETEWILTAFPTDSLTSNLKTATQENSS